MIKRIDSKEAYEVIIKAFAETDLDITRENCPGYSGFLSLRKLEAAENSGLRIYGYFNHELIGCFALEKVSDVRYKLMYLAVLKAYRHQGIGHEMLSYAEQIAKEEACIYLKLGMLRDNQKLYDFYLSRGYELKKLKAYKTRIKIAFMEKKL